MVSRFLRWKSLRCRCRVRATEMKAVIEIEVCATGVLLGHVRSPDSQTLIEEALLKEIGILPTGFIKIDADRGLIVKSTNFKLVY